MDKIKYNKLFPPSRGVNFSKLRINDDCVSFVTPPKEAKLIASKALEHIKKYKSSIDDVTVVDATACMGGDTIALCELFSNVIAIEIDSERFENLNNNLAQYNYRNVQTINGNSLHVLPTLFNIDIIVLDVPWGGKDYKSKKNLRLMFDNLELEDFILRCFSNSFAAYQPKIIISKMPKNYDIKYMHDLLSPMLTISLYEAGKMNIYVIEKRDDPVIKIDKFINSRVLLCDRMSVIKNMTNDIVCSAINNACDNICNKINS